MIDHLPSDAPCMHAQVASDIARDDPEFSQKNLVVMNSPLVSTHED